MRSTFAAAAALLAATLALACGNLLGIHDIEPQDGGTPEGDGSPDGSRADAAPDVTVDMGSDTAAESETDVRGDSLPSACDVDAAGVAVAGCPCVQPGSLACAGIGQTGALLCGANHTWTTSGTCQGGQVCDPYAGTMQGTCVNTDPLCAGASPGSLVCADDVTIARCSADLLSHTDVTTCTNSACIAGICTGVCTPGTVESCTNSSTVRICDPNGQYVQQNCTEPNPDCGPHAVGNQMVLGCTCYGRRVGINCIDAVQLAWGTSPGGHVAVDAVNVYWANQTSIQSTSIASGATSIPVGALPGPPLFRLNSAGLYWESNQSLWTNAGDAGAHAVVAATPNATDFALDDTAAYVIEQSTALVRVPLDGSAQTTMASSPSPLHVAIDTTTAYFTDAMTGIWSVPLTGNVPTQLLSTSNAFPIAVDKLYVYFEQLGCQDAGTCWPLFAMPRDGGATTMMASPAQTSNLVAYNGIVYFTDLTNIMSVPVGGGAVTTLATPKGGVFDLAVDGANVYWADPVGYGVWKVAHP